MSSTRCSLVEEVVRVLESRDPEEIVRFFEERGEGLLFLPVMPDATIIHDVVVERRGCELAARIVYETRGEKTETTMLCTGVRNKLYCTGVIQGPHGGAQR